MVTSTESVSVGSFSRQVEAALPELVETRLTQGDPRLYRTVLALLERPLIQLALELTGGNQVRAARLLGINRNTLRKRLRALSLAPPPRKRSAPLLSP